MAIQWKIEQSSASRTIAEVTFTVGTFVHGGGISTWDQNKPKLGNPLDPITPVRLFGIRGQLRFWWRATHGCQYKSVDEMRTQEAKLFGAAASTADAGGPGLVEIELLKTPTLGKDVEIFESKPNRDKTQYNPRALRSSPLAYGAFALQHKGGQNNQTDNGKLHQLIGKGKLRVSVRAGQKLINKDKQEVLDAIGALFRFGGIGGRTRRGFGALFASEGLPHLNVEDLLKEHRTLNEVPGIPGGKFVAVGNDHEFRDAQHAHDQCLAALKHFRQGPDMGRNRAAQDSRSPAGRSRWPEADEIRRLAKRHAPAHKPEHPVQKFPRAAFGMPILFHFQGQGEGEPKAHTLNPKGYERMASPLILRPVKNGDRFQVGALVLGHQLPAVECAQGPSTPRGVEASLERNEAENITPLHGEPDPLQAFLNFLQQ